MLFGLLFWDVIFESIPGAFETPYQTAPLDIAEDSFFYARKDLMEKRLAAIEAGKGADLVRAVDAEHRASETWCVGVRWDLFSSEDIVDILTVNLLQIPDPYNSSRWALNSASAEKHSPSFAALSAKTTHLGHPVAQTYSYGTLKNGLANSWRSRAPEIPFKRTNEYAYHVFYLHGTDTSPRSGLTSC